MLPPVALRVIAPPFLPVPEYEDEEEDILPVKMLPPVALILIAPPSPPVPEYEDEEE